MHCGTGIAEFNNYSEFREACVCEVSGFINTKIINNPTYFTLGPSLKRYNLLELAFQYGDFELVSIVVAILTGLIIQAASREYSAIVENLLKTQKLVTGPTSLYWLSCSGAGDIHEKILEAVSGSWLDESVLNEPYCLIGRLHP